MKLRFIQILFITTAVVLAFTSCKKTNNQELRDNEKELLKKYIAKYHSDADPKPSGLYYIEEVAGDAAKDSIVAGDIVKVFYKGYLIEENDTVGIQDGYQFDSSGTYEPFTFTVGAGQVITGWDEAIKYMKDGGKAKWIIPSSLGYGSTTTGYIPRYSTLVFYVELYKVYREDDEIPEISKTMRDLIR